MEFKLDLPKTLEPFRNEIEATLKPCVRFASTPAKKTNLWQSKFAGMPYLPKDFIYPINKKTKKPLFLLAQINFEEVPPLEFFPQKGILQIYIDIFGENYDYGRDPQDGTDQTGFRILYHPEVTKNEFLLCKDFSFLPYESWGWWKDREYALNFEKSYEPISFDDYRFESSYSEELKEILLEDKDNNNWFAYNDLLDGNEAQGANKLGGYHQSMVGGDPRREDFRIEESLLLIQFDGCSVFSWGDLGSAKFFIKKKDLIQLNFNNVIYWWDD